MIKKKEQEIWIDNDNKIFIKIFKENNRIVKFSINFSANINGKWYAIYRVDNYHGFLHEQKLWRTKEPIPMEPFESWDLHIAFDYFFDQIINNHEKYRKYFEEASQ